MTPRSKKHFRQACPCSAAHRVTLETAQATTGVRLKKEWISVIDRDTRPSHVEANGQTVAASADFVVGGEPCSFPGDRRLSAAERIHCRCTSVTTGIEAAFSIARL